VSDHLVVEKPPVLMTDLLWRADEPHFQNAPAPARVGAAERPQLTDHGDVAARRRGDGRLDARPNGDRVVRDDGWRRDDGEGGRGGCSWAARPSPREARFQSQGGAGADASRERRSDVAAHARGASRAGSRRRGERSSIRVSTSVATTRATMRAGSRTLSKWLI